MNRPRRTTSIAAKAFGSQTGPLSSRSSYKAHRIQWKAQARCTNPKSQATLR